MNCRKPHAQTPVVSCYPAPTPVDDFVLLFLPPCGPHLTPLATGSLEPSLLVSPLLGGHAMLRPFALALHLHQCKSSRNLHLQYSTKSQSTPRCQSLITPGSDHPLVLRHSGPQQPHLDAAQVLTHQKNEKCCTYGHHFIRQRRSNTCCSYIIRDGHPLKFLMNLHWAKFFKPVHTKNRIKMS
jgi:hypothetical protein